MASIIKTTAADSGARPSTFNFDDMSAKADAYVKQVRDQAGKIVAEARKEAEKIRRQAEIDGLKAAQKQMQTMVEAETARRMQTVIPAVQAAVAELKNTKSAWQAHWEATGVRLACRIAARILRRELTHTPELPLKLIREALELSVAADGIRILLNPQDLQHLGNQVTALTAEFAPTGRVEIVPDDRIAAGGCKLETRHGSIDQQIATQLERIEEELS